MKVALIHDWLTGMRGGEKVLEVFCELFPDADIFTLLHIKGSVSKLIENRNIKTSFIQKLPFVEKKYRHFLPLFPSAIEQFDLGGYDLILSSSHCVAKGIIPSPDAISISYVHTPMRYIWDMYYDYFGRGRAGVLTRFAMLFVADYLRKWDVNSTNRCDYLIANSKHVAGRIKRYYNRDADVIYPPVETKRFNISNALADYFLIVSAFAPYKRIDIAIEAFNKLSLPLKIVGTGQDEKRLKGLAGKNIEFLGWRNEDELVELYSKCKALIFPGEEDFGIVPVEAMASGRPVIAYGKGGALETVMPLNQGIGVREQGLEEKPTGIFFYELTPEALIEAVRFLEKKYELFNPELIRKYSLKFDKEIFKKKIADYIKEKYKGFRG
jgi:glycosyltransferase involved in cell wall biosynthesis